MFCFVFYFYFFPVHPDSQHLFAFTYKGQQYTWTRLPQGYTESPTLYTRALKKDLSEVIFPGESTLIQYVDDLLVASPLAHACEIDSIVLLKALAERGYKASFPKLQLCKDTVTYLGHQLSGNTRILSPDRITAISNIPKPSSILQMKSFLGAIGYCRQWISDYALLSRPLQDISMPSSPDPLQWTDNAADYTKPFLHETTALLSLSSLNSTALGNAPLPTAAYN